MQNYILTINCEYLNEAGVLVSHTLKTIAHAMPNVTDKYMFMQKHFKPIVIQIMHVIDAASGMPAQLICDGEEVDDVENIKEVFDCSCFTVDQPFI